MIMMIYCGDRQQTQSKTIEIKIVMNQLVVVDLF
jgi:hypothetical protein